MKLKSLAPAAALVMATGCNSGGFVEAMQKAGEGLGLVDAKEPAAAVVEPPKTAEECNATFETQKAGFRTEGPQIRSEFGRKSDQYAAFRGRVTAAKAERDACLETAKAAAEAAAAQPKPEAKSGEDTKPTDAKACAATVQTDIAELGKPKAKQKYRACMKAAGITY